MVERTIKKQTHLIPDSLNHSGGTVTAVVNGSSFQVVLSGLVADSQYFLYLRMNAGTLQLFFSTIIPSVYRASFPEALLVGAFITNASAAFVELNNITNPSSTFGTAEARTVGTIYQAETDGWVRFQATGTSSTTGLYRWEGRTDSSSNPSTYVIGCYATAHSAAQWFNGCVTGMAFPVKKGDYYRVLQVNISGSITLSVSMTWVPNMTSGVALKDM